MCWGYTINIILIQFFVVLENSTNKINEFRQKKIQFLFVFGLQKTFYKHFLPIEKKCNSISFSYGVAVEKQIFAIN